MRDLVLDYLINQAFRTFKVAKELPFGQNGVQLFVKSPKTIYVDGEQYATEPFIKVFNGKDINLETTSIVVYLATDAKQLPQEYSSVVSSIKQASMIDTDNKYFRKTSDVSTEFANDLLITTIELRYSKLLTS